MLSADDSEQAEGGGVMDELIKIDFMEGTDDS